jgi:dolichyl-phosphate beta-glucosyltransferase
MNPPRHCSKTAAQTCSHFGLILSAPQIIRQKIPDFCRLDLDSMCLLVIVCAIYDKTQWIAHPYNMKSTIFLSIIIPAYNEGDRICEALGPTIAYLQAQAYGSEIIVVSDGSRDNTRTVAEGFRSSFPNLRVLEYFPNHGKGCAVRTGMLAAQGERVLFMDADYAVPIRYVEQAFQVLDAGNDVAIGSRGATGAHMNNRQSPLREFASRMYTTVQNRWIKVNFLDTQCGFKMYTRRAAQLLFAQQKLNSVIFDGELLFLAQRAKLKVGEFAVEWTHHPDSRITYNLWKSLQVFSELFKIRWLHRFGR